MTVTAFSAPTVLIRAARGSDGVALDRLAELDSSRVPAGDLIVAESDGALVAAHSPDARATIADPFRPTADVVHLLEVRGAMLRAA
jgi:hypothetical protein